MPGILDQVAHRPWPVPSPPWIMAQTWRDLLFAHWPLHPEAVRQHVPAGLQLDTFDGQAWIGIVPFTITGLRLRWLPPIPGLSSFPELNVRTYVTAEGKPGVWFFSLDAANAVAVAAARAWFHLPYFRARMQSQQCDAWIRYPSERSHAGAPGATFEGNSSTSEPIVAFRPPGRHGRLGSAARHAIMSIPCLRDVGGPKTTNVHSVVHHAIVNQPVSFEKPPVPPETALQSDGKHIRKPLFQMEGLIDFFLFFCRQQ